MVSKYSSQAAAPRRINLSFSHSRHLVRLWITLCYIIPNAMWLEFEPQRQGTLTLAMRCLSLTLGRSSVDTHPLCTWVSWPEVFSVVGGAGYRLRPGPCSAEQLLQSVSTNTARSVRFSQTIHTNHQIPRPWSLSLRDYRSGHPYAKLSR